MKKREPHTLRSIQREVDGALRRKTAHPKQSLNQVILDELAVGTSGRKSNADFTDLVGQWIPDPASDEMLAMRRLIDADKWT